MDVADFRGPFARPRRISRIVSQEDPIALEVGSAAGGICNDRIDSIKFERINLKSGKLFGRVGLPVVCMQRAAAILKPRRVNLATIGQKNIHRIPINVRKNDILHAARENDNPVRDRTLRALHRFDELSGEFRLGRRRHPFQFPIAIRKKLVQPESTKQFLSAGRPIQPEQTTGKSKQSRARKKSPENQRTNHVATWVLQHPGRLSLLPRGLEELRILDTSRTRGLTSQAAKTKIHLLAKDPAGFEPIDRRSRA